MDDSKILLNKVLVICRNKSNIGVDEWHVLKKEIECYLDGKKFDIKKVNIIKTERINQHSIINRLKREKKELESDLKKLEYKLSLYNQFKNGIKTLVNQLEKK